LHYDAHTWTEAADGYYGIGTWPIQQVSPDGRSSTVMEGLLAGFAG
jgi:hypothetical protein